MFCFLIKTNMFYKNNELISKLINMGFVQCYRSFQLLFEQNIPFTRRAKVQLYLFFHEHDKKRKGSTS